MRSECMNVLGENAVSPSVTVSGVTIRPKGISDRLNISELSEEFLLALPPASDSWTAPSSKAPTSADEAAPLPVSEGFRCC